MIKKWLNRKLQNPSTTCCESVNRPRLTSDRAITFVLHPAEGGTVIEMLDYDATTGISHNRLYLIADGQDLAEEFSKILTLESLKR
jgi:molybdenum cofactor biosynthesis enzyme MoaA